MYVYVLIEISEVNQQVANVWTYLRAMDAWEQYRRLKVSGAKNVMIVKSIVGHLVSIPDSAHGRKVYERDLVDDSGTSGRRGDGGA